MDQNLATFMAFTFNNPTEGRITTTIDYSNIMKVLNTVIKSSLTIPHAFWNKASTKRWGPSDFSLPLNTAFLIFLFKKSCPRCFFFLQGFWCKSQNSSLSWNVWNKVFLIIWYSQSSHWGMKLLKIILQKMYIWLSSIYKNH